MAERTYDIVAFGSTGFTGRLVADYLAQQPSPTSQASDNAQTPQKTQALRWALAGRNEKALEEIRQRYIRKGVPCPPAGIVLADTRNEATLRSMARSTRVVLTTVGPYVQYGEPLVRACVEEGTDYVDITGEPEFVAKVIARYDAEARAKNLRIVSCCGFDSIPHDLGVYFTLKHLPKTGPVTVEGFVQAKGKPSGGTWDSALTAFSRFRATQQAQKAMVLSQAPRPAGARVGSSKPRLRYVPELQSWACPMPTIDPQVVLRTARETGAYGPEFRYGHYARVKRLPTVVGGLVGVGTLFALAQIKPAREMLRKLLPSGEGPSAEDRAKSRFRVTFLGIAGETRVTTEVRGGDPGYSETAKMVAEAALALAKDRAELPPYVGVLSPAAAMGDVLLTRLQNAGIVFEVVSTPNGSAHP